MPSPKTATALIVDDTTVARAAVVRRLRALDVACVEAVSAATAIAIDAATIDCALLDLDLGDGWGIDVAEALRAKRPELPVAFFTAGAPDDVLARAKLAGPVFAKPDDLDRALAWIQSHVK